MPSGPAFTFIAIASLVASALGSIHPTGRATLARRHSRVAEARANNGKFVLEDDFRGHNFFDGFNFFTEKDPTNGMVNYVDRQTAFANNLSYVNQNGQAVIRVDRTSYLEPGQYRNSVRIHSKKNYGNGLIVLDLAAMPSNKCSQWAAFWMNSGEKQWPYGGEVDVIEGVNNGNTNAMTLHTSDGCHLDTSPDARAQFSGEVHATDCNAFQNGNAGCGIGDSDPLSYGHEFNVRGGGVFVTLMDDSGIRIWRFGRNEIPADLADGAIPDPESWPQPKAFWSKNSCSREFIDQKQMIIFNITLCGDWAGSVYNMMGCQGTCADAVRDPNNYKWARFAVNSLRIFKHA